MISEVKMEVTPGLSERVQEIVLANGGELGYEGTEIKHLICKYSYIYINKKGKLAYSEDKSYFEKGKYKKVSAYDFIASQGEQEWLPKYNEEVMFSDNEKDWHKKQFKSYLPDYSYPFITEGNIEWKFCKLLLKEISFIQFLKDVGIYDAYMDSVKIENQRWSIKSNYKTLDEIQSLPNKEWTSKTFDWMRQSEYKFQFWENLDKKWLKIIEQNSDTNIVWGE